MQVLLEAHSMQSCTHIVQTEPAFPSDHFHRSHGVHVPLVNVFEILQVEQVSAVAQMEQLAVPQEVQAFVPLEYWP